MQRVTDPIPCLPYTEIAVKGMLSLRQRRGSLGGSIPGLEPFTGSGPQRMEISSFSSRQGYI